MIRILKGKTYAVGEQAGRYFFAYSKGILLIDELPSVSVNDEKRGVEWFETEKEAFDAYLNAINFDN